MYWTKGVYNTPMALVDSKLIIFVLWWNNEHRIFVLTIEHGFY